MSDPRLAAWFGPYTPPFVVAGPCSAESEQQVVQTALALAARPEVRLLRAGLWKPRTRPGSFEGVGAVGLPWLRRARQESGLGVAIEVATPAHVALALESGIDLLWLGARTTANPFAVQALADALRGTDAVVAIKNPINPDLGLWCGAVERIGGAGLDRILLIHRGFARYGRGEYRNPPMWSIPIEMMRLYPDLPMLCDPSHIAGRRDLVESLVTSAVGMGVPGLLVEVHPDPPSALSDAAQQLRPEELASLLGRLVYRSGQSADAAFEARLRRLRARIDVLDEELLDVLVRRMEVVMEIGRGKAEANVSALQIERWSRVLRGRMDRAVARGLRARYVQALLELVHAEAVRVQADMCAATEEGRGGER